MHYSETQHPAAEKKFILTFCASMKVKDFYHPTKQTAQMETIRF